MIRDIPGLATMAKHTSGLHKLDLSSWPPIYVSNTHFELTEDLHELEDDLTAAGAPLTYDIKEAGIILSKAIQKKRIRLDLRSKGIFAEEVTNLIAEENGAVPASTQPLSRKRKYDHSQGTREDAIPLDSSTDSESPDDLRSKRSARKCFSSAVPNELPGKLVKVVKIDWFTESKKVGHARPLQNFLTFVGRRVERQGATEKPDLKLGVHSHGGQKAAYPSPTPSSLTQPSSGREILQRVEEDSAKDFSQVSGARIGRGKFGLHTPSLISSSWENGPGTGAKYAHLLQETTTEHDNGVSSDLPEMPEWVKAGLKYACERLTPKDSPNQRFIDLLKEIRTARLLTSDEIGVRAYSTSIASIAAYGHQISNAREITALPGCDVKLANLWIEWKNNDKIQAVEDIRKNPDLKVLREFYGIWGVGSTTAQDFYTNKGWKELDDIIEYGWHDLNRVQQIGVKYYDEFQDLIPRAEVEQISEVVRQHAVKVRDGGIQTMIVGGYRRGKEACGDVDIVVSHPDEAATANLVEDVVNSLEADEWITHTLILSLSGTERGQKTLPFREGGGGHGFDTLDKALVVWQNPDWPTRDRDLTESSKARNPNIHRRVDIIVSPWRTVGCAVIGWSGGTTFERDLRRFAKNERGWKFDSSGVRDRGNGEVMDIEGYHKWKGKERIEGRAKTMEEAERRVFEGFGLEYRAPSERCTG